VKRKALQRTSNGLNFEEAESNRQKVHDAVQAIEHANDIPRVNVLADIRKADNIREKERNVLVHTRLHRPTGAEPFGRVLGQERLEQLFFALQRLAQLFHFQRVVHLRTEMLAQKDRVAVVAVHGKIAQRQVHFHELIQILRIGRHDQHGLRGIVGDEHNAGLEQN
jgi:hypothetical protein